MLSAFIRIARLFASPKLATTWTAEFIDDRLATPRHRKHLDYYGKRKYPIAEAISHVTDIDIETVENQLNHLPNFLVNENQDPGMNIKWSATPQLTAFTYTLVRLLKPELVVVTGVGAGVSSWTILHAMEENSTGTLISIDLPTPNTRLLPDVGYLVPEELRHRWDFQKGPSQRLLPQILSEVKEIDMFLHDSRHSYSNQLREYQTAWPFIRPGGILLSDDVNNDALYEASRIWNCEPYIIGQRKDSPIGIVGKS